jgi:hypothetical protein
MLVCCCDSYMVLVLHCGMLVCCDSCMSNCLWLHAIWHTPLPTLIPAGLRHLLIRVCAT